MIKRIFMIGNNWWNEFDSSVIPIIIEFQKNNKNFTFGYDQGPIDYYKNSKDFENFFNFIVVAEDYITKQNILKEIEIVGHETKRRM